MRKIVDLKGQVFGRLTVLELVKKVGEKPRWLCACACGNKKIIRAVSLRSGDTKSCGCFQGGVIDLTGQKFGRLSVLSFTKNNKNKAAWLCVCSCGKEVTVDGYSLSSGNTSSCGCYARDMASYYSSTHGKSSAPIYRVWQGMIERCEYPNHTGYKNYGGRGISVCDRWHKFENFLQDMGEPPSGLQIDRKDNSKGYSKENCHWVTGKQNMRNTRVNRMVEYLGNRICLAELAELTGLSRDDLKFRLNSGMSVEDAIKSVRAKKGMMKINDKKRRDGVFYTPKKWVDRAHHRIAQDFGKNWKDEYIVWDCSCGSGNLTNGYKFKELYMSTLEQADIDSIVCNPEAVKFQYDFLNDGADEDMFDDSFLPEGLEEAIYSGKKILFFINPPYATSANAGTKLGDHKAGVGDTKTGAEMKRNGWGACSAQLYAQFLYRIYTYQKVNKNISIAVFCPPSFMASGSYKEFRKNFFAEFGFKSAFLFQASEFEGLSPLWGISFSTWGRATGQINNFDHDVIND